MSAKVSASERERGTAKFLMTVIQLCEPIEPSELVHITSSTRSMARLWRLGADPIWIGRDRARDILRVRVAAGKAAATRLQSLPKYRKAA